MIQVITYICLLILLIFPDQVFPQDILLTETRDRSAFGLPCTEYYFEVSFSDIPTRKVIARRFEPNINSEGTVILTAGGTGKSYYSATYGAQSQYLIDSLLQNNLEVWDLKYDEPNGWSESCEGIGSYHKAVEIYAVLVEYLYTNYFQNTDKVFATGNSGGSFQIAFALAEFKLDYIFDMVVLTGGPPISDLKGGIFGDQSLVHRWPTGVAGGFKLTDFLMGWIEERYCTNRSAPDSIVNALDTVSLVSKVESRSYNYSTFVNFVQSDDPTKANHQARLYYEVIESEKAWYDLDEVDIHSVPSTLQGSNHILNLILQYINTDFTSVAEEDKLSTYFYPIPFKNVLYVSANKPISSISIFDLKGKLIGKYNSNNLNTVDWLTGHYFAKVYFKDRTRTIKNLIKLK